MLKSIISVKFFDQLMHMNDLEEEELNTALLEYMELKKVGAVRKDSALNRRFRQRKSWAEFQSGLTDRQFRRYFRMSRECFQLLCDRIEANVGEEEFKSEEYLKNLKHTDIESEKKKVNLMYAHEASTGGFVSGEIKLALTLRLLAGGSHLDISSVKIIRSKRSRSSSVAFFLSSIVRLHLSSAHFSNSLCDRKYKNSSLQCISSCIANSICT
jgi:hypothetical protein